MQHNILRLQRSESKNVKPYFLKDVLLVSCNYCPKNGTLKQFDNLM